MSKEQDDNRQIETVVDRDFQAFQRKVCSLMEEGYKCADSNITEVMVNGEKYYKRIMARVKVNIQEELDRMTVNHNLRRIIMELDRRTRNLNEEEEE